MYLSRLYIENYRSVEQMDIYFSSGKNIITGKNNAGKSNIINAIDLVLGEYSPTYQKSSNISEMDFHKSNVSHPIFIYCELNKEPEDVFDFSEIKNSAIFKISDKDLNDRFGTIDRKFLIDFDDKDTIFQFCGEDGENLVDSTYKKQWIGGKSYCKKNSSPWSFANEFYGITDFAFAFKAEMNTEGKITKNIVFLYKKKTDIAWFISPSSIMRDVLFQSAIIPAFRDPSNQLKISNWSWYGKLLKSKIQTNANLDDAFEGVNTASETIFEALTNEVFDNKLKTAFPGTKVRFSLSPLNVDLHKQALIYVNDGHESLLQSKGSGIQSAVIIALFDYYTREVSRKDGAALLAIEEPELYLHPHGRRVIANRLNQFIGNGDRRNQVILTTHSSEFISVAHEDVNIISVRKENGKTQAKNFDFRVNPSLTVGEQRSTRKIKQILLRPHNTELFFADFVLLTEDAKLFIEEVSRKIGSEDPSLGENWLNDNNISVINVGGKHEFWKFSKVCGELNIPCIVCADFDFLRDGISEFHTHLNISGGYINTIKSSLTFNPGKHGANYSALSDLSEISQGTIRNISEELVNNGVFLLDSTLESFYLDGKNPTETKEQGVLQTLEKMTEEEKDIGEYIDTTQIKKLLQNIIQRLSIECNTGEDNPIESNEVSTAVVDIEIDETQEKIRTKYQYPNLGTEEEISIEDIPF